MFTYSIITINIIIALKAIDLDTYMKTHANKLICWVKLISIKNDKKIGKGNKNLKKRMLIFILQDK